MSRRTGSPTLLLAAALAEEAARLEPGSAAAHRQRASPRCAPRSPWTARHDAAFEQLRTLLADAGDEPGLAAALADRIAVAANPFEVTSLRLTRAELLAKLGDRPGARAELDAILGKQPEHPRALARLSELLWDEGAWSDAGEVYLRRTVLERDPKALEEVFLRLGHIYRERVPDPKRAVTSYERVRTLDPDNREALAALSELYLAESDPKLAMPVTERLVALETEPTRRTAYRVRLGELAMRAGDMRRAGVELRRAVDGSPRDLAAVTALVQLLDRARDPVGRKALLDHTVGLLRHDVSRGEMDIGTLRSLSSLLALRERPRAAAAAAQLVAALEAAEREDARRRKRTAPGAGCRPSGVRRSTSGSFPPGLIPGVRQLLRLVGPYLRPTGNELGQQLARQGVTRAERVGRGVSPRPTFEALAADLAPGDFDLYLKPTARGAATVPVRSSPGTRPRSSWAARLSTSGQARSGSPPGGRCAWWRPTSTCWRRSPPRRRGPCSPASFARSSLNTSILRCARRWPRSRRRGPRGWSPRSSSSRFCRSRWSAPGRSISSPAHGGAGRRERRRPARRR